MQFVRIPPGEFLQGSPISETLRSENEAQHRVRITRPYWLGTTQVTVGQFAAFVISTGYETLAERQGWAHGAWDVENNEWSKLPDASWKNPSFQQGPNHPVVCVNWEDMMAFCDWLGVQENRSYRLPTEAEWEYACRAGAATAYPWGDDPEAGKGWANCSDRTTAEKFTLFPAFNWSDGYVYTSPVASFRPNAFGLHDMIGNTLQRCNDWYGDYPTGPVDDPAGVAEGKEKVLRGGAFIYGPKHCRCAFRGRTPPEFANFYIGFRVVMDSDRKENGRKAETNP